MINIAPPDGPPLVSVSYDLPNDRVVFHFLDHGKPIVHTSIPLAQFLRELEIPIFHANRHHRIPERGPAKRFGPLTP